MKFCIGIVSYLPKDAENRKLRLDRLERLLAQIDNFWPCIDILIIAQNWKDFNESVSHFKALFLDKFADELLEKIKAAKADLKYNDDQDCDDDEDDFDDWLDDDKKCTKPS